MSVEEKLNKDTYSDDEIDLNNDDYDVELESASDDNGGDDKIDDGKTIVKEKKKKKKEITENSEEETSDIESEYIDDYTAYQYKLDSMNPDELMNEMKALPNVHINKAFDGPINYIKYNILEKHKGHDEYIVPHDACKTSHILQKAEKTELIGIRGEHLSRGAHPYVDIINETDPIQIAIKELKMRRFPLLLKRQLNSFESEIKNPNEMTIIWED